MSEEQITKLVDFYLNNPPPTDVENVQAMVSYNTDLRHVLERLLEFIELGAKGAEGRLTVRHYLMTRPDHSPILTPVPDHELRVDKDGDVHYGSDKVIEDGSPVRLGGDDPEWADPIARAKPTDHLHSEPAPASILIPLHNRNLTERQQAVLACLIKHKWSRSAVARELGVSQASVSGMIRRVWPEQIQKVGNV